MVNRPGLSPRIKNYREFDGKQLTAEESLRMFGGNSPMLRRVADLASLTQSTTQRHEQPTSESRPISEMQPQ